MLPYMTRDGQPCDSFKSRSERRHPRCEPEDPENEGEGEERGNRGNDGRREEEEEGDECSADEQVEERDEECISGGGTEYTIQLPLLPFGHQQR